MAKMYPFPAVNFKNESEKNLYNLFREKLSPDYSVLYGRSWVDKSNKGNPDPECDFIITKPESGILIIEQKGGLWERKDGNWLCYGNPVKLSDDPFNQAKGNKNALIKYLRSKMRGFFPIDYAIAFPDTNINFNEDSDSLPNILTYGDLDYINDWMENAMLDCLQKNNPTKTDRGMVDCLIENLMRDYVVRLNEILEKDDKSLLILTEQQLQLDRSMARQKRLTIQGCAGSGKTLMAIKQVKRLAKESKVRKILFTCFNRELGQWLNKNTLDLKDKVETIPFLDFCEQYAREMGVVNDLDLKDQTYFDNLPINFLQANENLIKQYDAIVVDEGQSFKKDWWDVLESLLVDKESSYFYVFFDDFQRIYQEVINPVPGEDEAHDLYINLRNTANIHRYATKFLPKEKLPDCNNIEGEPVWIHFYESGLDGGSNPSFKPMKEVLRKLLHQLIQVGGVSSQDIIILTPRSSTSSFRPKELIGPYKLVHLESEDSNSIRYTTIQSFRGMERKVIIIAEIDGEVEDIKSLIYLGCSRAKSKLILLLSDDLDQEITDELLINAQNITGTI